MLYSSGGRYGFGDRVVDGMSLQINAVVVDFKSKAFQASINVSTIALCHHMFYVYLFFCYHYILKFKNNVIGLFSIRINFKLYKIVLLMILILTLMSG